MEVNLMDDQAAIPAEAQLAAVQSKEKGSDRSIYTKIVQILLYTVAVLIPLFYLPFTSSALEYNKQLLLVLAAFVGIVVWLLGVVVSGKLTIRTSPLDKGVLALLVASAVATGFSLVRAKSIFGIAGSSASAFITVLALSALYFLAVNTLHDRGRMLRSALSLSVVIALGLGLMQIFTWYFLPGSFTNSRAFNTVGSLNALGLLAAIVLPMFAKTCIKARDRFTLVVGIVGAVVGVLTLAILNWWILWVIALAGMLAVIAFDSLNATQLAQDYGSRANRFALGRFIIPVTIIVLGGFLLLVGFSPRGLKSQLPVEVSPSYRLSWDVTTAVIKDRPLVGYGPENFSLAFDKFGAGRLSSTQLASIRFFDGTSEIFSVATQGGLLALIALALLGWSLVQVVRKFTGALSESVTRGEGAFFALESSGVLAGLIAASVALFLYPFNLTITTVWYLLMAIAGLVVAGENSRTIDIEARPMYSLSASLGFIASLIVTLSGVYFFSVMYLGDMRYAQAAKAATPTEALDKLGKAINLNNKNDRYLREASQVSLGLLREEINKKEGEKNAQRIQDLMSSSVQLAQRATQVAPLDSQNFNNLGLIYRSMTGLVENVEQLAEGAFKKASELRPGDPTFDNSIGQMWVARADLIRQVARSATGANATRLAAQSDDSLKNAERAFKQAIEKSPSFGLAIYNLGGVYDRQNNVDEAIRQLEKILPHNANQPTLMFEIGLLYIRADLKDNATAALRRAVLLAPNYANARWYLALLLEEQKDIDGALAQLYEIQKDNKDNQILKDKIVQLEAGKISIPPAEVIDSEPLE